MVETKLIDPYYIIGLDPGKTGGICIFRIEDGKVVQVALSRLPVDEETSRAKIDKLLLWASENTLLKEPWDIHVFLEKVHAFRGQGVCSMFTFGRMYGVLEGFIDGLKLFADNHNVKVVQHDVSPKTWTKVLVPEASKSESDRKKAGYFERVKELFPFLEEHVVSARGNPVYGLVDAILISEYGRRYMTKQLPEDIKIDDVVEVEGLEMRVYNIKKGFTITARDLTEIEKELEKSIKAKNYKRTVLIIEAEKFIAETRLQIERYKMNILKRIRGEFSEGNSPKVSKRSSKRQPR